jgi:hypothetical protein
MLSSEMLRHIALVRTDILEELIASIIRVTRIGEPGTVLAITNNQSTMMIEAICSSETSVLIRATRLKISEDGILHHPPLEVLSSSCICH